MTFLGYPFHIAAGTGLFVDVITTSVVVYVYLWKRRINLRIAVILGGEDLLEA
ncbi:hypothetical protein OXIME_000699 [Oxyplasma meridianum]|uniref:Uncharacterized protein n=1 Tax=Oxyplasma meridianum TaxID=3073602 RepID=A0AAX4NGP0_9ARCH